MTTYVIHGLRCRIVRHDPPLDPQEMLDPPLLNMGILLFELIGKPTPKRGEPDMSIE